MLTFDSGVRRLVSPFSEQVDTQRHYDLLQWPTRLADGLGLKETAPVAAATYTPRIGSPVLLVEGDSTLD